ncbi:MAG: hypothetical protein KC933_27795 [Myxococcales bacterium]|nr:hypothetical protein [Myxococcales bacterium]
MSLPSAVFLRHAQGVPIGPLPLWWLEVLFDSRVVDGTTPVSLDGQRFTRLEEWPEILGRLETVKAALTRGEDPWSEPEPTPSTPEAMVLAAERTVIGRMVRLSAQSATGTMTLGGVDGVITLDFKDGRVVSVSTDIERLSLAGFLLFDELVDQAALDEAAAKAPSMGGDLGGALIALGKVQPHVYFEKYLAWAKKVLGAAVAEPFEVSFEAGDVATPAVPLGFDRLGAAMDAVRAKAQPRPPPPPPTITVAPPPPTQTEPPASPPPEAVTPAPPPEDDDGGTSPWLWVGIGAGVAVVGGVVAGVLLAGRGGAEGECGPTGGGCLDVVIR